LREFDALREFDHLARDAIALRALSFATAVSRPSDVCLLGAFVVPI
jgi:hypothetical protein